MIGSAASSYPPSSFAAIVTTYSPSSKIAICLARYSPVTSSAPTANATLCGGSVSNANRRILRCAFDHSRAFLGVTVGDQQIADLFRDRRLENRLLELRQAL